MIQESRGSGASGTGCAGSGSGGSRGGCDAQDWDGGRVRWLH